MVTEINIWSTQPSYISKVYVDQQPTCTWKGYIPLILLCAKRDYICFDLNECFISGYFSENNAERFLNPAAEMLDLWVALQIEQLLTDDNW